MRKTTWPVAIVSMIALPEAALAQATDPLEEGEVVSLVDWDYEALYEEGWSAEDLLDSDVYGPNADDIGEVENLVIGPDGKILSLVAEVGGLWDIGDTHVSVPWDQVKLDADADEATIPVTEENVDEYSMFEEWRLSAADAKAGVQQVDDELLTGPRAWRATEFIDDYVFLEDQLEYGYVDDLIFNAAGELEAVVVRPDISYGARGVYAYPYYGYDYGWDPGLDYYALPYGEEDVEELEPLEEDRL